LRALPLLQFLLAERERSATHLSLDENIAGQSQTDPESPASANERLCVNPDIKIALWRLVS
jgi:hypothetical protein